MNFSENLENARNFAVNAAQKGAQKAKVLAAIAKANVNIYSEEDKIKKAELELGKLYYRDYAVGEEMDSAEYLPWCEKIDESKKRIAELKDSIDDMKAGMANDADVAAAAAETAGEEDFADTQPKDEEPQAEEAQAEEPVVIEISGGDEPKAE